MDLRHDFADFSPVTQISEGCWKRGPNGWVIKSH